jgi:uncharacterized protein YjaZ
VNEPIDITKGLGWDDATWAIHEQTVEKAARKADVGLEYLGITYEEWKVGLIHNAEISRGEAINLGGCALNAVSFLIYTTQAAHYKPRKVYNAADWSSLTVHEVVHCARFEQYPMTNPVELVATEGLAHVAQRAYIAQFCAKQIVPPILDYDLEQPDPALYEQLRAVANGHGTYHESYEWAKEVGIGNEVNNGSLIGTQLVHRLVNKGYSLPDLMNQPAGDILGL